VANPIREFFKGRSADIQNQLNEIKAKLEESKNEAKLAQENLEKAEEKVKEIATDSNEEAFELLKLLGLPFKKENN